MNPTVACHPNKEKVWMRAGPEFEDEEGKLFIVHCALYGLKLVSASFRSYMADKLEELSCAPPVADPDVWMRPAAQRSRRLAKNTTSTS